MVCRAAILLFSISASDSIKNAQNRVEILLNIPV